MKREFPEADIELMQSSGGRFEVSVDGRLVFSKAKLGRHAQPGEVLNLIRRGSAE